MYFQFFILHDWRKRSAIQPQGIFPEFPYNTKNRIALSSDPSVTKPKNTRRKAPVITAIDSASQNCDSPADIL